MTTCPDCEAPLAREATFCRDCGWDAELQRASWRGEDVELPEALDYEAFLAREGLGGRRPPLTWSRLTAWLLLGLMLLGLLSWGSIF